MFTSQKYSQAAERSLASFTAIFRKTSSIIPNGSLLGGTAYAAANPAMAEAVP